MSHIVVNSILPAAVYNSLIIYHEATERTVLTELKQKHLPSLFKLLVTHGVANFVELHILHWHFTLREAEALVDKMLDIPDLKISPEFASVSQKQWVASNPSRPT
ncbi:hypothetical protein DL770_001838 [Monosporascus sp. CRB-9-2]|nr:hypothetical protein DL770_001838 [Monosporascus sp. CRB-9-2]